MSLENDVEIEAGEATLSTTQTDHLHNLQLR